MSNRSGQLPAGIPDNLANLQYGSLNGDCMVSYPHRYICLYPYYQIFRVLEYCLAAAVEVAAMVSPSLSLVKSVATFSFGYCYCCPCSSSCFCCSCLFIVHLSRLLSLKEGGREGVVGVGWVGGDWWLMST